MNVCVSTLFLLAKACMFIVVFCNKKNDVLLSGLRLIMDSRAQIESRQLSWAIVHSIASLMSPAHITERLSAACRRSSVSQLPGTLWRRRLRLSSFRLTGDVEAAAAKLAGREFSIVPSYFATCNPIDWSSSRQAATPLVLLQATGPEQNQPRYGFPSPSSTLDGISLNPDI